MADDGFRLQAYAEDWSADELRILMKGTLAPGKEIPQKLVFGSDLAYYDLEYWPLRLEQLAPYGDDISNDDAFRWRSW